jgi:hypothetical protein
VTARNYCPAIQCNHLTKAAKAEAHGAPEEFEKEVWRSHAQGFVTTEDAIDTTARYRAEYEAAPDKKED